MSFKTVLMGFGAGIAFSLVALKFWSDYVDRTKFEAAQAQPQSLGSPRSEGLPRPWFPQVQGDLYRVWKLETVDGRTVTLQDFRGKVVFLNFWSTTCPPCFAEMPGIERLQASLNSEQVVFIAATVEDPQRVRKFLRQKKMRLPIYIGQHPVPESFGAENRPTTVILDKNGTAVFRQVGALDWDNEEARSYLRSLARQTTADQTVVIGLAR